MPYPGSSHMSLFSCQLDQIITLLILSSKFDRREWRSVVGDLRGSNIKPPRICCYAPRGTRLPLQTQRIEPWCRQATYEHAHRHYDHVCDYAYPNHRYSGMNHWNSMLLICRNRRARSCSSSSLERRLSVLQHPSQP